MPFLSRRSFTNQSLPDKDDRPIVFIDSQVANHKSLLQQVVWEARVILLHAENDGVKGITEILNSSSCRQVYLICHGSPGSLRLGNAELSLNTLIQYERELGSWFVSSEPGVEQGALHLYGSNVAAGDGGTEFITKLSRLTGVRIGASANVNRCMVIN